MSMSMPNLYSPHPVGKYQIPIPVPYLTSFQLYGLGQYEDSNTAKRAFDEVLERAPILYVKQEDVFNAYAKLFKEVMILAIVMNDHVFTNYLSTTLVPTTLAGRVKLLDLDGLDLDRHVFRFAIDNHLAQGGSAHGPSTIMIKTLIVLGADVNATYEDAQSILDKSLGEGDLNLVKLLKGYGARESEQTPFLTNYPHLVTLSAELNAEKPPIEGILNDTLVDGRFKDLNKIIMEYVVPPSAEINYTVTHLGIERDPIKEVVDGVLPSYASEIIADYAETSSVEINVI